MRSIPKSAYLILFLSALLLLAGCAAKGNGPSEGQGPEITLFKSPSCGCCVGWAGYMEDEGFAVDTVMTTDMSSIKARFGIPANMESCHTAVIGDYFVEGHVPEEIIQKMLSEKPDIDGIMLPRMPSGSPGMPGQKTGVWIIYQLKDGEVSEYTRI